MVKLGRIFNALNFFTRLDAIFAEEYHTGRFQSSRFSFQPDLAVLRRGLDAEAAVFRDVPKSPCGRNHPT